MRIADAHCDTLYEIAIKGTKPQDCVVTPETIKQGDIGLQTFALFASRPQGTAYENGRKMLRTSYDLPVPILRGKLPDSFPTETCGVISCEGGEMFEGSLEHLREFDDETRLRMVALTWNFENEIASPAKEGTDNKLKPFGRDLVREMDRRGILADCSHLNDAGFYEVAELSTLPIIASHSDCRWLCNHFRNLTKDMVKVIIEKKGFIGINFYGCFLKESGQTTLDDVIRHVDEMMELGAEDILGFGSDFDGIDEWPVELPDPSGFPALLNALKNRGYSDTQLEKMAHGNLWRVLKTADNARVI
ncbi:MAG: membrane dipeptidase [Clostridia bacterium]|nr:membrane dipeptidase [Clostridia bacterium]